ncbi:MAG: hypothetical protein WC217_01750, partial [Candidatus Paceibacterota bacterium]
MNVSRVYVRQFLLASGLITSPLLVVILVFVKKWDDVTKVLVFLAGLGNTGFCLWLILDAIVVAYYLKKIRPITGHQYFSKQFFFEGVSWQHLQKLAATVEPKLRQIAERAKPFPGLNIQGVLHIEGISAALALIERAEHEAASVAKAAAERFQKEERRTNGAEKLAERAIALGIDPSVAGDLACTDIDRLRSVVALGERKKEILDQASHQGCLEIVRPLVELGAIAEAEMLLLKAASYIERASELGVEEVVRAHIAHDDLSLAMKAIEGAKEQRAFRDLKESLAVRIEALEAADRRHRARELL